MGNPEKIDSNRRGIFALAALPLLIFGFGKRARAATPAACFDPKTLTAGQTSQRNGVHFKVSTDAAKRCGVCMYFSGDPAACGKCQILLNGPVGGNNVCDAWTKKAGA